jgi:2-iminobutanoate/2-iminopropanoate deaminase
MSENEIKRVKSPAIPGISDSVRVADDELIFISGTVALPEGGAFDDFDQGVEAVLTELDHALERAGTDRRHLVKITVYITDLDKSKLASFRTVRDGWLDGAEPPASTLIGVASLFDDSISIEIDAVAAPSE